MAGLGVLLETQKSFTNRTTQIICKTSFLKNSTLSSSSAAAAAGAAGSSTFLESCFLCRRKLQPGKDIYMYRGDWGFCSEECRRRQIFMDEESGKRDCCSAAADGEHVAELRRGTGPALAGGFAW